MKHVMFWCGGHPSLGQSNKRAVRACYLTDECLEKRYANLRGEWYSYRYNHTQSSSLSLDAVDPRPTKHDVRFWTCAYRVIVITAEVGLGASERGFIGFGVTSLVVRPNIRCFMKVNARDIHQLLSMWFQTWRRSTASCNNIFPLQKVIFSTSQTPFETGRSIVVVRSGQQARTLRSLPCRHVIPSATLPRSRELNLKSLFGGHEACEIGSTSRNHSNASLLHRKA